MRALTLGNVVVTGGAGFIGSHLCDELLARGSFVTCVDSLVGTGGSTRNIAHLSAEPRFELVVDDVLEWAQGADLGAVSCVFHQAASKNTVCRDDPERDLLVNGLATLRLLRAAARDGVPKFVHASTGSVLGEAAGRPDAPARPVSYYGVSKLAGETYCEIVAASSGLDVTALRYHHVIGPRQDDSDSGGVVPIFARRALAGEPLIVHGSGDQTRSFTSVQDVVRVNLLAAQAPQLSGQVVACASGVSVSVRELAEYVNAATGNTAGIEYGPRRAGDIDHFEIDASALRELGVEFDTDWRGVVDAVIASLVAAAAA